MNILRRWPRGQIAVVFTFSIVALLGIMALGTDLSVSYQQWAILQKAADAAALAGANYLPEQPALAQSTATNYAVLNGLKTTEVATTVSGDNLQIAVNTSRSVPYYFGAVLGL